MRYDQQDYDYDMASMKARQSFARMYFTIAMEGDSREFFDIAMQHLAVAHDFRMSIRKPNR